MRGHDRRGGPDRSCGGVAPDRPRLPEVGLRARTSFAPARASRTGAPLFLSPGFGRLHGAHGPRLPTGTGRVHRESGRYREFPTDPRTHLHPIPAAAREPPPWASAPFSGSDPPRAREVGELLTLVGCPAAGGPSPRRADRRLRGSPPFGPAGAPS